MNEAALFVEGKGPRAIHPEVARLIDMSAQVGPRYTADPMGMLTLPAIYEKKLRRLFPSQGVDPRRNAIASSLQYTATVVLTELAQIGDAALLEAFIDSLCEAQHNAFEAMDAGNRGMRDASGQEG